MTSQTGQKVIIIHILPNTSKSKGNWEIELGQLIKYNARNIFFQKSSTKLGRKTSFRLLFVF